MNRKNVNSIDEALELGLTNDQLDRDEKERLNLYVLMRCKNCGKTWQAEWDIRTLTPDSEMRLLVDEEYIWQCYNCEGWESEIIENDLSMEYWMSEKWRYE